jgi:hypothetical protein
MMNMKLWIVAAGLALPLATGCKSTDEGSVESAGGTAVEADAGAGTGSTGTGSTGTGSTASGSAGTGGSTGGTGATADAGTGSGSGGTGGGGGVGSSIPALVNVNLENVLNDLSVRIQVDRANIPVNAQIPVNVAANVCGVSVNVLSVSTGGQASCTAKVATPELAQVVQQQIAAGGSVGGGAQGGSTATTGGATGNAGSSTSGATGTGATSTGTSEGTPPDEPN